MHFKLLRYLAVDAVCFELVSVKNPWYQGILQGNSRIERVSRRG